MKFKDSNQKALDTQEYLYVIKNREIFIDIKF